MTLVGVAELKAALSSYLARVREGETVTVTDHGRPVAKLVPIDPPADLQGSVTIVSPDEDELFSTGEVWSSDV